MFDINFFKNTYSLKSDIINGKYKDIPRDIIFDTFEKYRSRKPHIFNIETTNSCNMKCVMCPRTSLMKRKIETMDVRLFEDLIRQVNPISQEEADDFFRFVKNNYNIESTNRDENAFYFYVVSTHLILHGYGEPLLDPYIIERVKKCTEKNVPTYFSCVPANIRIDQIKRLMEVGLSVLKFSIDSLSDKEQQRIRGPRNDFTESYEKISEVIKMKKKNGLKTNLAASMIGLSAAKESIEAEKRFMELWEDQAVYAYIKSQDNRWLYKENFEIINRSHYERQYCEYPFTSMTIMADGSVVPCTQDYNTEMVFGNVKESSIEEIWHNEKFRDFRRRHITGEFPKGFKCSQRCDQKLICQRIGGVK